MHKMFNGHTTGSGPETTGLTLHNSLHYDIFSSLMGLGANQGNSRRVVELAQIKPGDRVLDVGCGTGNLTQAAARNAGPEGGAQGIDASPEMIDLAQAKARRSGSQAAFSLGLMEKLDFPDASFDVVISRLAMHHLPDNLKPQALAEVFRVLKPGGRLLIADFNPSGNPVQNHVMSLLVGPMMEHANVSAYPALLAAAGFADVTSGPAGSAFLKYVTGMKPAI